MTLSLLSGGSGPLSPRRCCRCHVQFRKHQCQNISPGLGPGPVRRTYLIGGGSINPARRRDSDRIERHSRILIARTERECYLHFSDDHCDVVLGLEMKTPPLKLPDRPRILVVTLRRIGDVLLTTPLIRSLRRAWPDATIDALVFNGTVGILKGNPDIDYIVAMPARPTLIETAKLMIRLWKCYDLALSTQSGDRPVMFALAAGRTHIGLTDVDGPKIGGAFKRIALHRGVPSAKNIHRVEQMLQFADALGIERAPDLVCPAAAAPAHVAP